MSSTQSTLPAAEPTATSARRDHTRLVGASAIAVAVGVVAENVVLAAAGAPGYDTPIDEVATYFAAQRGAVAVAAGIVAVYLPLLLVLVTGLHGIVERRGGAGTLWSRLAVAAGAAAAAVFVLVNVLQVGLAVSADGLTEASPAFELVWHVHAAAFAFVLPMLGATAAGVALAAHASGLTRPWLRVLGLVGGGLMLVVGVGNLAVADGSPLIFVGLLGFALWLIWLVATGLRLIRS